MSRNFISKNDELRKGDYLLSNNEKYKAVFQEDGNFVIYGWKPLWSSDTAGINDVHRLCMQGDCNLVMYRKDGNAVWQTDTHEPKPFNMCRLCLCNDGNLVVHEEGKEVWSSAHSRGQK